MLTGFEDIDKFLEIMNENKKLFKEDYGYDDKLEEIEYWKERTYSLHHTTEKFKVIKAKAIHELKVEMSETFDGYFNAIAEEKQKLRTEANRRLATDGGREYVKHSRALQDKNTSATLKVGIKSRMDELRGQWVAVM